MCVKICDCQTSGVQNCPHYRVKYNPFDDNKRTKPEKYDVYTSVLLNREELILLRKLCEQIDDTKMRLNLTNRFGGALLKFGSPLFETKVRDLDEEHES